jgi:hypothetical protein
MSTPSNPAAIEDEWFVFFCHVCSQPLKVRSSQAGARLRCPACQTETTIPGAADVTAPPSTEAVEPAGGDDHPPDSGATGPESHDGSDESGRRVRLPQTRAIEAGPLISQANPEFRPDAGMESPRTQLAVDRLAKVEFRNIDDPAFAIPEKGLRIRKRKRRSHQPHKDAHAPGWDANDEAAAAEPVGPDAAEGWHEVTTATVGVEVREDGAVVQRRKRIKRKRLPGFIEKAFVGLGRAARLGVVAFGALIIAGAVIGGIYLARSRDDAPAAPSFPKESADRVIPNAEEAAIAERVARDFLAADGVEPKLAFVRFPEKVRPLMEKWYLTRSADPLIASRPAELVDLKKLVSVDGLRFVVIAIELLPSRDVRFFAVQLGPAGTGKLDWEVSVGYQPMPLDEFQLTRPTRPMPFRVAVREGDYYNGEFADATRWLCCELTYPGDPDFRIFGYADRLTPAGRRLADWLSAGSPSVILGLAYSSRDAESRQALITGIVREHWFLPDGPVVPEPAK